MPVDATPETFKELTGEGSVFVDFWGPRCQPCIAMMPTIAKLEGKKVIALGERDGVPGPAIAECVRSAGAEPVFIETECFV